MVSTRCTLAGQRRRALLQACLVSPKGRKALLGGLSLPILVPMLPRSFRFSYSLIDCCRLSGNLRTKEQGADTVIWLALQPKEKLVPGAFYFDRAEAPKNLPFAGSRGSHALIDSVVGKLRSMAGLVS